MKISFFAYNIYGIGGTVRTVVNTANYLASQGHEVEIISVMKTSQIPRFTIDSKVKLTPLINLKAKLDAGKIKTTLASVLKKIPSVLIDKNEDLYKNFSAYSDIVVYKKIKGLNTDILITTFPSLNVLSARFASTRILKIGQEHAQLSAHNNTIVKKIKKYYKQLDVLTILTEKEKIDYQLLIGETLAMKIIPNAVPETPLKSDYSNKVIISAGRFVYEKGFEILIRAYAPLANKYPEWKLKIFGSGVDYEIMREEINRLEVYNNVFLYPLSTNIMKEFSEVSMFASSSRFESFGMAVIEAMAVGLPVVSFDSYGPSQIIDDQKDGFVVTMEDESLLRERIERLILNKHELIEMGSAAIDKSSLYSIETIGRMWEEIFSKK